MRKKLIKTDLFRAKMQRLYNKSAPMLILESVLFAVFGVFMLIQPVGFLSVMVTLFAIMLMLIGGYRVVSGLVASQEYGGGWMDVLFGMFDIIIGVLFWILGFLLISWTQWSEVFPINMIPSWTCVWTDARR